MFQMVHLFLVLMAILKNKLLPTRTVLLLPYQILLFQKVFPLIFTKTKIQEVTGFGKWFFQDIYYSLEKYYIQITTWCYSWTEHEKESSNDLKGSWDIWVVIFRRWCHNFKMSIVEYTGLWRKYISFCFGNCLFSRSFSLRK